MRVFKLETIIQSPCQEGFDEDNFVQNLRVFKTIYYSLYIPRSNNFLTIIFQL